MEKESMELAVNFFEKVLTKAGVITEQMWPYLVRQQYIDFFLSTVILVILSTIIYKLSKFIIKNWNPEKGYSIYKSDHEVLYIVSFL